MPATATEPSFLRRPALIAVAVAVIAVAAHLPSLTYGFVFDEQVLIVDNPAVNTFSLSRIFAEKFWPGPSRGIYYRPIVTLSYAAAYALAGPAPWLHHLLSLLFHAGAAAALYFLGRRLLGREGPAAIAGLLFAALPVHVESVAWVPGRTDVLAAGFLALTWLALLRGRESTRRPAWLAAAVGLFLLALGSKEVAVMLPALLILSDCSRARPGRKELPDYLMLALTAALFLAWRAHVLAGPGPEPAPPALAGLAWFDRILAIAAIPGLAAIKIILPLPWRIDYAYDWIARDRAATVPLALAALALAAAAAAGLLRRRVWATPLALFFLALAPVMHLISFPTYFAERFLYLPSFFLLIALAAVLAPALERPGTATRAAAAALVVVMAALSWGQGRWFRSDLTFWQAAVRQVPDLATAHNGLGIAWQKRNEFSRAEKEFSSALRLDPEYSVAASNLALVLFRTGRAEQAEALLTRLIQAEPDNPDFHFNLAVIYANQKKKTEALRELAAVTRLRPDYPEADALKKFIGPAE